MRKIISLLCSLLISTTTFPIFDLSPWIVIDNNTKTNFNCKIEAVYYPEEDEEIMLIIEDQKNLNINFDAEQDANDYSFLKITMTFVCYAESTMIFKPIFSKNEIMFNPDIKTIECTYPSLQITSYCELTNIDQRYFRIDYQPDYGITLSLQPISLYIKCLSQFKESLRAIILAALNVTNWLPY